METAALIEFVELVIDGDVRGAKRRLRAAPELATIAAPIGLRSLFFPQIRHYIYGGDTALHMAAAASSLPMAELLVSHGASVRAKNRRGAEPLHYASDGNRPDQRQQAAVIEYLISVGADANAVDKSGVAPLHRAVRKRSIAAIQALLDGGADLRQRNKSGSTPLHLAVQNTGASGSGSDESRQRQKEVIKLLLARGAKSTDKNSRGKTVAQAATSAWIRALLNEVTSG